MTTTPRTRRPQQAGRADGARQVDEANRAQDVLRMRVAGHSFVEIGKQLGYADETGPRKLFDRVLKRIVAPDADEVRKLMTERLDAMTSKLWAIFNADHPLVHQGVVVPGMLDFRPNLDAARALLSIAERQAKMLGLDAPTRSVVQVVDPDSFMDRVQMLEKMVAENDHAGSLALPAGRSDR